MALTVTGMKFDVLDLQSGGVICTETDVFNAPPIEVQDEKLAQSDGSVIVKKRIAAKAFTCSGTLTGSGATASDRIIALDNLRDTFMRGLNKQEQNFDVDYAGSTRRYIATPRNIMISRPKGLDTAGWSVEFFCANPVGMDTTTSTLLSPATITVPNSSQSITVGGSYKAEPKITLTITTVTGGTGGTITISNDSTLRGVAITRNWANGDVLEVDCLNKTIFVNNSVVPFTGQFPAWEPGLSGINYLDTFTARNVSLTATYTKRYL